MKFVYLSLAFFFFNANLYATKFKIEPAELVIAKTTDFDYVYDYSEIINLSGEPLIISWSKEYLTEIPSNWQTSVQCPGDFHDDSHIETSTFELSSQSKYDHKFIFHVYPNNSLGYVEAAFHFHEVNSPDEIQTVIFKVSIYDNISSITDLPVTKYVQLLNNQLYFTEYVAEASIFDINGNLVNQLDGNVSYNLEHLVSGFYIVNIQTIDNKILHHKIIKH